MPAGSSDILSTSNRPLSASDDIRPAAIPKPAIASCGLSLCDTLVPAFIYVPPQTVAASCLAIPPTHVSATSRDDVTILARNPAMLPKMKCIARAPYRIESDTWLSPSTLGSGVNKFSSAGCTRKKCGGTNRTAQTAMPVAAPVPNHPIVVVDSEKGADFLGIITERDLVYRICAEGRSGKVVRVQEIMSSLIATKDPQ